MTLYDYVSLQSMVYHILLTITPSGTANAFWRNLQNTAWTGCLAPTRLDQLGHGHESKIAIQGAHVLSLMICVVLQCTHTIPDNHFRPNWLWSCMCQSRVPTTSGISTIIHWYFWKTQVFGLSSLPNPYLERHPDEVAKKIQTKISGILWVPDGWLQGLIRLKSIEYIGDSLLVGGWPTPLKKIRVRQLGWLFHSQFRWKMIQSCSSHHQLDIICVSMYI